MELRDRPELRGKPVVVGGLGTRGVVLSATYEARAFGVRSAMPVGRARRLCPQAVFIPPRHPLYGEVSREVMAIFRAVTPEVEPLSLDEAFLDVSGARRRLGSPAAIAELIRRQVREQQSITCSVGVAPVKFVAKIASARCKPDGLLVVPAHGLLDFLHPLPVSALWGVGDKAEEVLARLGLRTVGDIAHVPAATLRRELGVGRASTCTPWPGAATSGRSCPRREEKSVGAEETFPVDVDDPDGHQAGAAAAVRPDRAGAARRRVRGADGDREAPAGQLQDHHPVADAGRADRRGQGDLRDRVRALRGLRARRPGAAAAGRRPGRPGCAPPPGRRGSWRSMTARPAGGKRSRPWTGSPAGSGPARCGRPALFKIF